MKLTLATTLPLAAAVSAQNALRVEPLSVKLLSESQTARIDFTVVDLRDGQGGATTTCSTAWTPPNQTIGPFACTDDAFSFAFPNGIADVEAFTLSVTHLSWTGTAALNTHAGMAVYGCFEGDQPGVETDCHLLRGGHVYLTSVQV
ncbi:hypothetical protein ASPCAL13173 [Aspergillus calidoustus]|uniref:AA1-like domain-containing protein n=1 Tax=Aspergillus calidoustus TaxID=454130 RepID=A0A0U5GH07_ASPCI|nr:hypothetical protein ASPCAL13173 [Aspergillus calidoustus]